MPAILKGQQGGQRGWKGTTARGRGAGDMIRDIDFCYHDLIH